MNFQQLKIIRAAAHRRFNLTDVSNALFTSPSGVSKHIKDLEDELGVALFIRKGKRLLGLTAPGKELLVLVERMLTDAANIKQIADQYSKSDEGQLSVATTHTQARYVLPKIVKDFKTIFPKVHLQLHQGSPSEIAELLVRGEVDIGIATESLADIPTLISFPYYTWRHAVIVPREHSLATSKKPITLKQLANLPLITYHQGFTGRAKIDQAFAEVNLQPDIVLSALDADVIKTYVEMSMGVGIIAEMAFDTKRDQALRKITTQNLFGTNITRIAVKRGHYLRGFALRFIELCVPQINVAKIINEGEEIVE